MPVHPKHLSLDCFPQGKCFGGVSATGKRQFAYGTVAVALTILLAVLLGPSLYALVVPTAWIQPLFAFVLGSFLPGFLSNAWRWHQQDYGAASPGRRLVAVTAVDVEAPEVPSPVAQPPPPVVQPWVPQPGRINFAPDVPVELIPNARRLDTREKSRLWWQPEDFAEFLRVRVLIGRAYHAVARRRGVPVDSDFPPEPVLAHESRLGLCLGRQEERTQARKRYTSAVLAEQARQLASVASSQQDKGPCLPAAFHLDHEQLARAARHASKTECRYALQQAGLHHQKILKDLEQDRRGSHQLVRRISTGDTGRLARDRAPSSPAANDSSDELESEPQRPSRSVTEGSQPPRREDLAVEDLFKVLKGLHKGPMRELRVPAPEPSPRDRTIPTLEELPVAVRAEGFGQTKHELQRAGVSPTGHLLVSNTHRAWGRASKDVGKNGESESSEGEQQLSGQTWTSESATSCLGTETCSTTGSSISSLQFRQASGSSWDSACEGDCDSVEEAMLV